jgi:hypothetical protein
MSELDHSTIEYFRERDRKLRAETAQLIKERNLLACQLVKCDLCPAEIYVAYEGVCEYDRGDAGLSW